MTVVAIAPLMTSQSKLMHMSWKMNFCHIAVSRLRQTDRVTRRVLIEDCF